LFLLSYIFLVFGIFTHFDHFLKKKIQFKKEGNTFTSIVKYLIVIVIDCFFISVLVILSWFFLPFYPIVNSILN
jgi:hypothetical protein